MGRRLSLCMIVRDEVETLGCCLGSVQGLVDEIIVVDTGSQDGSAAVARRYGALVVEEPWRDDFAVARNRSLELATGTWVLYLDGDEELAPGSCGQVGAVLEADGVEGYFVQIVNQLGDGQTPAEEITTSLRLFRNRPQYRFIGALHEQVIPAILAARPEARLSGSQIRVLHRGYRDDLRLKKDKHRRNVRILNRMLGGAPADPFLHFNLGLEYLLSGQPGQAAASFAQALAAAPAERSWRPKLVKCYGAALAAMGRWSEVLALVDRELQRYPDYTDLHYLQGVAHQEVGNHARAIGAFTRCLALGPAPSPPFMSVDPSAGAARAQFALGRSCEALGDWVAAVRAYTAAARADRGWLLPRQRATLLMATIMARHGRHREALWYLDRTACTASVPPEWADLYALCRAEMNGGCGAYQMDGGDERGKGSCPQP